MEGMFEVKRVLEEKHYNEVGKDYTSNCGHETAPLCRNFCVALNDQNSLRFTLLYLKVMYIGSVG